MIINKDNICEILGKTVSYESYSPMFSDCGLKFRENENGVYGLCFNYNRKTRIVFDSFIEMPYALSTELSGADRLVFGDNCASLAFYGRNAFVIRSDSWIRIGAHITENVEMYRIEENDGEYFVFRGYSRNPDDRDPDGFCPFSFGIRVMRGTMGCDLCSITPSDGGVMAAVCFEGLDFDDISTRRLLSKAPADVGEAARICSEHIVSCMGNAAYVSGSERETELIAKALYGLIFNLTEAPGKLRGFVSAFPSRDGYCTHFLWDSCFQNLAYEDMNTDIAKDSLLLFAHSQRADGKLPQFMCSTWDRPHDTQPALAGWAALRLAKKLNDDDFNRTMFGFLEKNNRWWLNSRMTEKGVIFCIGGLETGQDDSPRFDDGPTLACDMNGYLLNQLGCTAEFAAMLGLSDREAYWKEKASVLRKAILENLWFGEENCFCDRNLATGEKIPVIGLSGIVPVWAGIEKKSVIADILLNADFFFGDIPFPCVAYNQPCYEHDNWWRGPLWYPVAWIALETLEKYGYEKEYREAAEKLYRILCEDGNMRELFDSKTGEGEGDYEQGWTCAIFLKLNKVLKHE